MLLEVFHLYKAFKEDKYIVYYMTPGILILTYVRDDNLKLIYSKE